jgi:hypothetical protein
MRGFSFMPFPYLLKGIIKIITPLILLVDIHNYLGMSKITRSCYTGYKNTDKH